MADYGSLPFAEQIAFFKDKLDLPTERWDDLLGAAHDRAFVVAGATGADLLADLHAAVRKGIEDGTTLAEFRRDFDRIVQARGWTGFTGSDSAEGIAWRTRVIYETNLRTSYAAGRWQQLQEVKADRPYLEYRHSESVLSPRPLHQSWDGLVLPADDPWWQTHYPPNGWGCKCRVFALSERDLKRLGKTGPDRAPDDGVRDWKDSRGVVHQVPNGIDPGWDYAPGASLGDDFVRAKAATLPEPLADAFKAAMAKTAGRVFVAQPTAAGAAKFAMDADLADFADYTGIKPEVANEWNRALLDHLERFPELRPQQKFTGSAQAQYRRWFELETEAQLPSWRARNPGVADAVLRKHIGRWLKKPKLDGRTWAHALDGSKTRTDVSGIAVNAKWGGNPAALQKSLETCVANGWHPPGCDTVRSIVDHELGHQLDALLTARTDPVIVAIWDEGAQAIASGLSHYAATKIAEMVAEGWAEYLNNPTPRRMARQIGERLEQLYRDRHAA